MNAIKRNIVLALGIALPLLLIAFVGIAQKITNSMIEDPQHGVVYAHFDNPYAAQGVELSVRDSKLSLLWTVPERPAGQTQAPQWYVNLVYFNPKTHNTTKVRVDSPVNAEPKSQIQVPLPDSFSQLTLVAGDTAPDGYRAEDRGYHGYGMMNEMFGTRENHSRIVLVKDGKRIPIMDELNRYGELRVLGWTASAVNSK